MCFVFIWEQTATCATYSINWLVFITQMKSVYSAVRTGSLHKAVCASSVKGINIWAADSSMAIFIQMRQLWTSVIEVQRSRNIEYIYRWTHQLPFKLNLWATIRCLCTTELTLDLPYFYGKTIQLHPYLKFILFGVSFYIFRTVFPSIITS